MRTLFISIPFYEYIETIRGEIADFTGGEVDCLVVDRRGKGLGYVINKITHGKYDSWKNTHAQNAFFKNKGNADYDVIFVLVGRGLNLELFKCFLKKQEKARTILYVWDDIARIEEFDKLKECFDRIFSFDVLESEKYGFEFLPLFYCNEYIYKGEKKDIDFSMVGSLHSDRIDVLDRVKKGLPSDRYKWRVLLMTTRTHALLKENRKDKKKTFSYSELPLSESAMILKKSKIAIDVPHPTQTGLTMRTIECLAAQTKLITTNESVKLYDFYSPDNILIIDRKAPIIESCFIEKPFSPLSAELMEKYSIKNWVKSVFAEK